MLKVDQLVASNWSCYPMYVIRGEASFKRQHLDLALTPSFEKISTYSQS